MNPLRAMVDNLEINKKQSIILEEYKNKLLKNNLDCDKNMYGDPFQQKNTTTLGRHRSNFIVDRETEYYLNNFGYRDSDWNSKAEVLAIGCSNTHGYGVSVDGRWTNILEKTIDKKIHNLSFPGGSINELVYKSFEYFKTFGNPDIVLCLFPDPFRIKLPVKKNLKITDFDSADVDSLMENVSFDHNPKENFQKTKYFKIPYSYEEVLPMELPLYFSMQSIHMLEQYCKSSNIKLIWSSWHYEFINVLNNMQENTFNNFFSNTNLFINAGLYSLDQNCHKDYKDKFEKYFHCGLDNEDGLNNAHPGVHTHVHIAEAFNKEINK